MRFDFLKQSAGPIGVDIGINAVRMVQFKTVKGRRTLLAGGSEPLPTGIEPYTGQWQRTVVEVIKSIYAGAPFKSRDVVTAIQCRDVFAKEIKIKPADYDTADDIVAGEVKKIVPFDPKDALIKRIELGGEDDDENQLRTILVMATEKAKVERHLAIFEKAALRVKAVTVFPIILTGCYSRMFGRRASDANVNVMLLSAQESRCNVIICKGSKILFARNISKGTDSLKTSQGKQEFIADIEACLRYFQSGRHLSVVEKIILFANEQVDGNLSDSVMTIAKGQSIPAHVGDVLKAVADKDIYSKGIDARDSQVDWTTAFGLALTGGNL